MTRRKLLQNKIIINAVKILRKMYFYNNLDFNKVEYEMRPNYKNKTILIRFFRK